KGLALEAIGLGRLLVQLMPQEPEAKGRLALMLHCEARRRARRTPEGGYVPLLEQDVTLWSKAMMDEAELLLSKASRASQLGRFQLEAAIQSAHAQRAHTGQTSWAAIELLYEGLVRLAPTIGALVGRAAAVAETRGLATAWDLLDAIPKDQVNDYQPYWALAAHILKRMGQSSEARAAYTRAIGLCEDPAMREYLQRQVTGSS
ncbi:MAG: RNA polymerase subunit sigma-70, partial [Acidobacteriaceae bacterium]|nr:RNA polymerase subunit sigma-70 [Acidobacteriaceae bacterium]